MATLLHVSMMSLLCQATVSAVEPRLSINDLDPSLTSEIKSLKTTLESVQGSLITSVGLIQDQLDQFSKQMTSSMDARLAKMEAKMTSFEESIKKLDERSSGWTNMQHHILSWGDQMISLDTKVDHLARSQMDRLTTVTGQVNSLQSTLALNVESLGEQITNLESRMHRATSRASFSSNFSLMLYLEGGLFPSSS